VEGWENLKQPWTEHWHLARIFTNNSFSRGTQRFVSAEYLFGRPKSLYKPDPTRISLQQTKEPENDISCISLKVLVGCVSASPILSNFCLFKPNLWTHSSHPILYIWVNKPIYISWPLLKKLMNWTLVINFTIASTLLIVQDASQKVEYYKLLLLISHHSTSCPRRFTREKKYHERTFKSLETKLLKYY